MLFQKYFSYSTLKEAEPALLVLIVIVYVFFMAIPLFIELVYAAPTVNDSRLEVKTVTAGLHKPTSMVFLEPDDILVLEKEEGTIQRIKNGVFLSEPVLKANINSTAYRGMLGIDAVKVANSVYFLFVYFTEASNNGTAIGNRLYRYTFVDDPSVGGAQGKIVASKLLLDLPVEGPDLSHNGGKVLVGPNGAVILVVGEIGREGKAQNIRNGSDLDGTGGVLAVDYNGGSLTKKGIFGTADPSNKYLAYGIRNSFGIDYDPLTKKLWITDNGRDSNDEINLIEAGFNGGWKMITGIAPKGTNFSNLVSFDGKGRYNDPEFVWIRSVGPTAIEFLNSTSLGKDYEHDMFVGDVNYGRIYKFDLDSNRTGLSFGGNLSDKIANTDSESKEAIFARGFRSVTDLKTGPGDGNLYVLSYADGAIYKIVPRVYPAALGGSPLIGATNRTEN